MAEAERRDGQRVLRGLVDDAFAASDAAGDRSVTVHLADVLRALRHVAISAQRGRTAA